MIDIQWEEGGVNGLTPVLSCQFTDATGDTLHNLNVLIGRIWNQDRAAESSAGQLNCRHTFLYS